MKATTITIAQKGSWSQAGMGKKAARAPYSGASRVYQAVAAAPTVTSPGKKSSPLTQRS